MTRLSASILLCKLEMWPIESRSSQKLDRVSNSYLLDIVPLAFLTAKAHGLKEMEVMLEETLRGMEGIDVESII